MYWKYIYLVLAFTILASLICVSVVKAEEINLSIIATIESNNNPNAYNKTSKAVGMYQITPICLKDYNQLNKNQFQLSEMFEPNKAKIVANWYLNKRIPQLLRHYRIIDTIDNRLWAYNAGIGRVVKNIKPLETRNYIIKYHKLERS